MTRVRGVRCREGVPVSGEGGLEDHAGNIGTRRGQSTNTHNDRRLANGSSAVSGAYADASAPPIGVPHSVSSQACAPKGSDVPARTPIRTRDLRP